MKKLTLLTCIPTALLSLTFGAPVYADEERSTEDEQVHAINDRHTYIADIVSYWDANKSFANGWEAEFTEALNSASDDDLRQIKDADNYDLVRAILQGRTVPVSIDGTVNMDALGDLTSDLTYTPVVPCRFFDTRFDNVSGKGHTSGSTATTHAYQVHGNANLLWHQGYNKGNNSGAGCPAPNGEPVGIAANFTAAGPAGNGNIRVWPFGGSLPNVSLVNYTAGTNIANAAIIATGYLIGDDINVTMQYGSVDALGDVTGYFYPIDTDDPAFNEVDFVGYNSGGTGGTLATTTSYQFIGPTDTATIPSGYKVLLNAMQAVGTNSSANDLDIAPCYLESPYTDNPVTIGGKVFNLEMNNDTRVPITINGVFTPLPGTYQFGMCYKTSSTSWDNNEYGYVSILVIKD